MREPAIIALLLGGIVLLIAAVAAWLVRRPRGASNVTVLRPDAEGVVAVPVTGTYTTGGFGSYSKNSLGGALAVAPEGIRYKVLVKGAWLFSEIERVDVRKTLFGASLMFENSKGGRMLVADVRDLDVARQALAALPPGVPLTAMATTVRDGGAAS